MRIAARVNVAPQSVVFLQEIVEKKTISSEKIQNFKPFLGIFAFLAQKNAKIIFYKKLAPPNPF